MTTNYSARDIHQLDQAAMAAFDDVDHLADDPETSRRLDERGPAVYGAELTRDLAAAISKRMSLAGFAALATIRRVQERREAAANVAELTAEMEKTRAECDEWKVEAHRFAAELNEAREIADTYAGEVGALKAELERMRAANAEAHNEGRKKAAADIENMPYELGDTGWQHLEDKATEAGYPVEWVRNRRRRDDFTTATIGAAYQYGYRAAAKVARGGVTTR